MGSSSENSTLLIEDAANRAHNGVKCLMALACSGDSEVHDAIHFIASGLLKHVQEIKQAVSS